MSGPLTFVRNLVTGDRPPLERIRLLATNIARRTSGDGCCGHYGDPGC